MSAEEQLIDTEKLAAQIAKDKSWVLVEAIAKGSYRLPLRIATETRAHLRVPVGKTYREMVSIYETAGMPLASMTVPFRAPHNSAGVGHLVGQKIGERFYPGELSLAHGGLLYLEDLGDFGLLAIREMAEVLRRGYARVGRRSFPARPQVVIASVREDLGSHRARLDPMLEVLSEELAIEPLKASARTTNSHRRAS